MSDPAVRVLYVPVDLMPELEKVAPVKWTGCRFSLFGITIKPNRSLPPDTWAAVYDMMSWSCVKSIRRKRMESKKFLKFHCPECDGDQVECVQVNAVVSDLVKVDATTGAVIYTDSPEISGDDLEIDRFQCPFCGYVLEGVKSEAELADYLRWKPYNLQRTKAEQQAIADAVDGVLAAQLAYDGACAKLDLSLRDRYTVCEHLALLRAYKVLYTAIGGCDELIKQVEAREADVGQNQ